MEMLDFPEARSIARILSVVLEETPFVLRPSNEVAQPEAPADKTPEQKLLTELQEAVAATRQRAETAEAKIVELKRGG